MNACIEAIFLHATAKKISVFASVNGFEGLIDGNIVPVTQHNAIGISHKSGCVFGANRSPRLKTSAHFKKAVDNIKKHGFGCVIVLGGNGSIVGSGRLKSAGVNILFVPATIDNDVPGYKNALGFSSACESAVKHIDTIQTTMRTSERDHIVQLMGRDCNELTLRVGQATFADVIDMSGARVTPEQVANVFKANRKMGKKSNMLLMQERKMESYCEQTANDAKFLKDISQAAGDDNIRLSVLGYLQRGADPSCHDRLLAISYGRATVDLITKKQFGVGLSFAHSTVNILNIEPAPIP